ncbi:MAG: hypothetical protein IAE90_06790 [Ignavibacteria bacterium]|nr:hypothetical protein [Ignavibacteria bacterium]
MVQWKVKLKNFRLLFAFGCTAIFVAWFIQNFQENDFKGQREELLQKQSTINFLFAGRRVWLESIYTHNAIMKDTVTSDKIYFTKVYNYLEMSMQIIKSINEILIADTLMLRKSNDSLTYSLGLCEDFFKNEQYDLLSKYTNYVNSSAPGGYNLNSKYAEAGNIIRKKLKELAESERDANNFYLWAYIIGTLLISVDYCVAKFSSKNAKHS